MNKALSNSYLLFAALQFVVLFFALGIAGMGFGGLFGAQNKDQALLGERLLLGGAALGGLAVLLLVLSVIAAAALRRGASWAAGLAKVIAWLAILEFPVGTAFSIYWFRRQHR